MDHPIYKALNEFKDKYGYDLMTPSPAQAFGANEPLEHERAAGAEINNTITEEYYVSSNS